MQLLWVNPLKTGASELLENIEEIYGTTWTVMLSAGLNLQSHTGMLPVEMGLIYDK